MEQQLYGTVVISRHEALKVVNAYEQWHSTTAATIEHEHLLFRVLRDTEKVTSWFGLVKRPFLKEDAEKAIEDGDFDGFLKFECAVPNNWEIIRALRALSHQKSEMVTITDRTALALNRMQERLAEDSEHPIADKWRAATLRLDKTRRERWGLV